MKLNDTIISSIFYFSHVMVRAWASCRIVMGNLLSSFIIFNEMDNDKFNLISSAIILRQSIS